MQNTAAQIFDRHALKLKKRRMQPHFAAHNFLHEHAAALISERLEDIRRTFPNALYCGAPLSNNHRALWKATSAIENLFTADLLLAPHTDLVVDEEFFPFSNQTLDLIISHLSLHQTNDLPGVLVQIQRALKPDGLLMASMFGGETLWQLRDALNHAEQTLTGGLSPRVHPFADKQQMGALMQRTDYALPVIDSEIITVTYPDIYKLMADLRGMGETNISTNRHKTILSKNFFEEVARYYAAHHTDQDGRIEATFEIIFVSGWAPHSSQQKPLKPGSAKTKLADFLGTEEIKTGERAG